MSQGSWQTQALRAFVAAAAALSLLAVPAGAVTLSVSDATTGFSPTSYVEGFVDVYVTGVSSQIVAAYELALDITPAGADAVFKSASATSGAHPPVVPGAGPTVIGTPGNRLRVVDYPNVALAENMGLVRARYRIAPGAKGIFDVDLNPAFTNLANQLGQPISIEQLVGGQITVENYLRGDVNLDGRVDLWDFVTLKQNAGKQGNREQGDLNGDGQVDMNDFNILKDSFGEQVLHAQPSSVPEPSSAILAGLALAALLAFRRRRS